MDIQPIETHYRGYRFRSRLEARWAVLFDALNIKWEYEPEGFQLSNGEWYLPDFKVDFELDPHSGEWYQTEEGGMWVEVKPSKYSDFHKAIQFAKDSNGEKMIWLADGTPDFKAYTVIWGNMQYHHVIDSNKFDWNRCHWNKNYILKRLNYDENIEFAEGTPCVHKAEGESRMYSCLDHDSEEGIIDKNDLRYVGETYMNAVRKARSARFDVDSMF